MNPAMWEAPATKENVARLRERGAELVFPGSGIVACGDVGNGRLAPVAAILGHVCRLLSPQDLSGVRVLLTLGPTREKFDAVRFWSNPSTGRMGACLATAAWLRGAEVHVVAGPCALQLPDGVARTDVTSAREMHGETKMKKDAIGEEGFTVAFDSNPDILAGLGASKRHDQRLIGFAAETDDLRANAMAKLERKNLDLIVANPVNAPGSGFGSRTNSVLVLDRTGRREEWPSLDKSEVAWRIWDHLAEI
jgi:phosphopantothenoylcysteine decarboxylase/phosphopantothenate--cysteine ligase